MVVVDEPKLDVMSLRTIPSSVSTFTPLVPSPGYGPPVSSGISDTHSVVDVLAVVAAVVSAVVAPDVETVVSADVAPVVVSTEPDDVGASVESDDDSPSPDPHAASDECPQPGTADGEQHAAPVHHRLQVVCESSVELVVFVVVVQRSRWSWWISNHRHIRGCWALAERSL